MNKINNVLIQSNEMDLIDTEIVTGTTPSFSQILYIYIYFFCNTDV